MIFFFNSKGDVINALPETIKQGSNKANRIWFFMPTSPSNVVNAYFRLPNGEYAEPQIMTLAKEIPEVKIDAQNFSCWFCDIKKSVTLYAGTLLVNFRITNDDEEVATESISVPIVSGVVPPLELEKSYTYAELMAYISILQDKLSNVLTEEEKAKVDKLVIDGDGTKYLSNDGKYKEIDLSKYQLKDDGNLNTESKEIVGAINELNNAIQNTDKLTYKVVNELPETGESNIIYLVPNTQSTDKNIKDEYMWINGTWELIGSTAIPLDTKLDKVTGTSTYNKIYIKDPKGNQTVLNGSHENRNSFVPQYSDASSSAVGANDFGYTFAVSMPQQPYQPTPKIFVETALEGKLDKYTSKGAKRLYGVRRSDGTQEMVQVFDTPEIGNIVNLIPQYFDKTSTANHGASLSDTKGVLLTNMPNQPYQCAPKKYVDEQIANAGGGGTQLYLHEMIMDRTTDENGDEYFYKIAITLPTSQAFEAFADLLEYLSENGLQSLFRMYYVKGDAGSDARAYYNLINGGYHTSAYDMFPHCTKMEEGITTIISLQDFITSWKTFEEYAPIPL